MKEYKQGMLLRVLRPYADVMLVLDVRSGLNYHREYDEIVCTYKGKVSVFGRSILSKHTEVIAELYEE